MFEFPTPPPTDFQLIFVTLLFFGVAAGIAGGLLWRTLREVRASHVLIWFAFGLVMAATMHATGENFVKAEILFFWGTILLWILVMSGMCLSIFLLSQSVDRDRITFQMIPILPLTLYTAFVLPDFVTTPSSPNTPFRRCKTNLKQLVLAMHNYYERDESLPLQTTGEPPHSWRVDLLPWIEQEALYQRYDQDTAWNEGANLPISKTFISSYFCPSMPNAANADGMAYTSYALAVDPDGIYSPDVPPRQLNQIPDGTSNTLLIVEACGQNLIWTDPHDIKTADVPLGVNLPGEKRGESNGVFSSYHLGGASIALADGSVKFLSQNTSPEVLKSLIKANDGPPGEF